ncbi:MAG: GxxExxY protein [Candidatus Cloacimonetes bacterium]|nr:GxxExxY protein [Candidatus Cloacimonadota bacterium]
MLRADVNNELTELIIGAFYDVYNALGYGFLERVYENALKHELKKRGLRVESQKPIKVYYDGVIVGEYFADLFVEDSVLLELKSAEKIRIEHEMQLFHYLKAMKIELGLLLNFGPKPEVKRKLWTNQKNNPCESVQSAQSV